MGSVVNELLVVSVMPVNVPPTPEGLPIRIPVLLIPAPVRSMPPATMVSPVCPTCSRMPVAEGVPVNEILPFAAIVTVLLESMVIAGVVFASDDDGMVRAWVRSILPSTEVLCGVLSAA